MLKRRLHIFYTNILYVQGDYSSRIRGHPYEFICSAYSGQRKAGAGAHLSTSGLGERRYSSLSLFLSLSLSLILRESAEFGAEPQYTTRGLESIVSQ
jgi:hypothetical protein